MKVYHIGLLSLLLVFSSLSSVAAQQTLTFVSGDYYPPFIWKDENGNIAGITVQILELIEKKIDVDFQIELMPFSEALRRLEEGKADVINFIFKTPEREKIFLFSDPVMNLETKVYCKKTLKIKTVTDLTPYLIGVVESDASADLLKEKNPSVTFKYFKNSEELMSAAKKGEIDAFVMDNLPAEYFMIKHDIFHQFSALPPISIQQIYFAFPSNKPEIAKIVNDGLSKISRKELQQLLGPFVRPTLLIPVWVWYLLAAGTGVFLAVFFLLIFINRYLARLVERKTLELKKKNEELTSANEELDAMNQELRASFQELEAMNEELNETNKNLETQTQKVLAFQNAFIRLLDISSKMTYETIQEKDFLFSLLKTFKEYASDLGKIGVALRSSEQGKTFFVICHDDRIISQRIDEAVDFQNPSSREFVLKIASQLCGSSTSRENCRFQEIRVLSSIYGLLFYDFDSSVSESDLKRLADLIAAFLSIRSYVREQGLLHKKLLLVMVKALEYYDYYTRGHSENVANYAAAFAEKLNLDKETVRRLYWAGLVHDVGKIFVSQQILNKNGFLSTEEYEYVKVHPVKSYELLSEVGLDDIAHIVRHHHERYDGKGYPDGLSGKQIPFESRILSLSDAFDAMTTSRPYKKGMSFAEAVVEIQRCGGTQFDPDLAKEFILMIEERYLQKTR
ncbi:MAG: HD domain-containing phosphohydrolase [Pseudothermotoga sp.]